MDPDVHRYLMVTGNTIGLTLHSLQAVVQTKRLLVELSGGVVNRVFWVESLYSPHNSLKQDNTCQSWPIFGKK